MITEALELEIDAYIQKMRHLRDERGHALVVRNGKAKERTVTLGAGVVKIRAPRVHDRRPEHRFTSRILPPYMRHSPRSEEALPMLYLRGLSTDDFSEALPVLLGPEAAGLTDDHQPPDPGLAGRSREPGANDRWWARITSTSGPMACISGYGWKKTGWPAW